MRLLPPLIFAELATFGPRLGLASVFLFGYLGCGDGAPPFENSSVTTEEQQPDAALTASQAPANPQNGSPSGSAIPPVPKPSATAGPSAPSSLPMTSSAGASSTGGSPPAANSASRPPPTAPSSSPAAPSAECSFADGLAWQLCDSGPGRCEVMFTDGTGCNAVCQSMGMECARVFENLDAECAPDTQRPALSCSQPTGHDSDYCVCEHAAGFVPPEEPLETGAVSTGGDTSGTSDEAQTSDAETGSTGSTEHTSEASTDNEPDPPIGPRRCGCETPAGESGALVDSTIVIASGEVFDGECLIYRANPATLGDGSQQEGQSPVFRLNSGAQLRNVVLGASAADGIHVYGDVRLENVHWLDIGEDALTVKESGRVDIECGSAFQGEDKVFQVNASSEIHISHFTSSGAGKFMRQNGGTTFRVDVTIDHSDISNMKEVIFRTDSTTSHVTVSNTRYSGLKGLFMFGSEVVNGNSNQSAVQNNQEY